MACDASRRRDGHSSCAPVARRVKQPTRTADLDWSGIAPVPFLFGLAPGGVCRAVSVAGNAVRSYRTVSPLPAAERYAPGRSVLCGTVPGVSPAGRYPAPFVHGARTFLPGRLSALARSGRPADWWTWHGLRASRRQDHGAPVVNRARERL